MEFEIRKVRTVAQGRRQLVREREECFRLMDQGLTSYEACRIVGINYRTGKRLGVLTWSPLHSGWLTSCFRRGEPVELTAFRKAVARKFDLSLPANQRNLDAVEQMRAAAEEAGVSLTHLALAFHPPCHGL